MTPNNWPAPDTHCWDDDEERDVWSYSKDQIREIVAAESAQLKLDADEMVRQMLTQMTAAIPLLDLHPDDYFEAMRDARKWLKENKDAD